MKCISSTSWKKLAILDLPFAASYYKRAWLTVTPSEQALILARHHGRYDLITFTKSATKEDKQELENYIRESYQESNTLEAMTAFAQRNFEDYEHDEQLESDLLTIGINARYKADHYKSENPYEFEVIE